MKFVGNKQIHSSDFVYEAPSFNIAATWEGFVEFVAQKTPLSTLSHSSTETFNLRTCLDWRELGSSNEDTFVRTFSQGIK